MLELSKTELAQRIRDRVSPHAPSLDPARLRVPVADGPPSEDVAQALARRAPTPAAVLIPLVDRGEDFTVLLTQRARHLRDHAGEVSFPGGRLEPADEGPVAAALRETEEETGIADQHIEVVGFLDGYITGTNFAVTPVVSFVSPGFTLALQQDEVDEVFEVPLRFMLDDSNRRIVYFESGGRRVGFWESYWEGRRIWGATAGMLKGLHDRLL